MTTEMIPTMMLQAFVPAPDELYSIEAAAHLAQIPRRHILVCCKRGMIAPHIDSQDGRYLFDREAIHLLQRIEYLRTECGVNLNGIQIILRLAAQMEQIRRDAGYL
jgi:DNA-binding transcriptional MerR regulator